MSHLHGNRSQRSEGSLIKQTVQYEFFLVVCAWLLYQIHHSLSVRRDSDCVYIENEEFVRVLGRKGGAGISRYSEDIQLYGVDLAKEDKRTKNDTGIDDDQFDSSYSEGSDAEQSSEKGEIAVNSVNTDSRQTDQGNDSGQVGLTDVQELGIRSVVDTKANALVGNDSKMLITEKSSYEHDEFIKRDESQDIELDSDVKVNAVILKKDESVEIFKFSDENGVPEHESGPSKRSDIQVESEHKRTIFCTVNQTNAFFLVVVCAWLQYHLDHSQFFRRDSDCTYIETACMSPYSEYSQLYEVHHVIEAKRIKKDNDYRFNTSYSEGTDDIVKRNEIQDIELDTEVYRVNAVILKLDNHAEFIKFSDGNGVSEQEAGTSKRRDMQVESDHKRTISSSQNQATDSATE